MNECVGATLALLIALKRICRNVWKVHLAKRAGVVGHCDEGSAELGWQILDPQLQRQNALFTKAEQT